MDYTVHGILQARILEWVALPFSRGSSQPKDQAQVSYIAGGFFTSWATREAYVDIYWNYNYKTMLHIFGAAKITQQLTHQVDSYFWERKKSTMTGNYALQMDVGFVFNASLFSGSSSFCTVSINDNSQNVFS